MLTNRFDLGCSCIAVWFGVGWGCNHLISNELQPWAVSGFSHMGSGSSLAGSQANPRRLPSVLLTPPHLRLRLRLPPELPLLARLDLPRRSRTTTAHCTMGGESLKEAWSQHPRPPLESSDRCKPQQRLPRSWSFIAGPTPCFPSLLAVAGHHSSREVQESRKGTTTSPDFSLDLATSLIHQSVCYSPRAIATLDGGGDSYDSRRGQK